MTLEWSAEKNKRIANVVENTAIFQARDRSKLRRQRKSVNKLYAINDNMTNCILRLLQMHTTDSTKPDARFWNIHFAHYKCARWMVHTMIFSNWNSQIEYKIDIATKLPSLYTKWFYHRKISYYSFSIYIRII